MASRNSSIQNLEEADLVLLIGTNPRLEATMVNARLRKAYLKRSIKIHPDKNPELNSLAVIVNQAKEILIKNSV